MAALPMCGRNNQETSVIPEHNLWQALPHHLVMKDGHLAQFKVISYLRKGKNCVNAATVYLNPAYRLN